MIGRLSGVIFGFEKDHLILDVQGVGYHVFASTRTLSRIGQVGDTASLLIDTHVREDHIHLYGFADAAEQSWFRLLNTVQGVGARAALSILAACPPEKLSLIIASQDVAAIRQADGVGPKLATRILTELKDKAGTMDLSKTAIPGIKAVKDEPAGVDHDAVSALVNLGYARSDAYGAVAQARAKANDNERDNLQAVIRLALKELSA
ncbi:MAG: Holliday junction branch migration protein RuvA [Alphaproteobacteria bacterium]